jgi:hypothetical protein
MTAYNRRIIGIVAVNVAPMVEAGICQILGAGYAGCFSVELSPNGEAPTTHLAGSAQCTEAQRDAVVALLNPAAGVYGFRGLAVGLETAETVPYVDAWPELPDATAEELRWDFDSACASLGLQRVRPPMPGVPDP